MCHPNWAPPCGSSASTAVITGVCRHTQRRECRLPICRTITSTRRSYLTLQTHCPHLRTRFDLRLLPTPQGPVLQGGGGRSYPAPLSPRAVCSLCQVGGWRAGRERCGGVCSLSATPRLAVARPGSWEPLRREDGGRLQGTPPCRLPLHHVRASAGPASPDLS